MIADRPFIWVGVIRKGVRNAIIVGHHHLEGPWRLLRVVRDDAYELTVSLPWCLRENNDVLKGSSPQLHIGFVNDVG